MDDEIHVVKQHPLGLAVALGMRRTHPQGFEAVIHRIGNGLDLARIGAAAHDEIVGESARISFQLKNGDLFGLFVLAGEDGFIDLTFEVVRFFS